MSGGGRASQGGAADLDISICHQGGRGGTRPAVQGSSYLKVEVSTGPGPSHNPCGWLAAWGGGHLLGTQGTHEQDFVPMGKPRLSGDWEDRASQGPAPYNLPPGPPEASLPQSPSSCRLTLELQHPPPLHTHPAQLHLPVHHWRSGSPGQACVAAIHHPTVGPATVRFPGSCLRGNGQKEKRGPPHFTEEPG